MDLQLKGKVALITGSSKGIGLKTALTLAEEGCHIGICARNQDELDKAVKKIEAKGVKVYGGTLDVADTDSWGKWVSDCADKLGGVDIFVANASYGGGDPSEEGWKRNFEIDVMGTRNGVETVMPHLEKSSAPAMVFVSTTAAVEHFLTAYSYNAMKAALLTYSSNLAVDLAPKGIRVNAVTPGPVFIEGGAWDQIKEAAPEIYDSTLANIPMGRFGSDTDVANAITFLASPCSAFTTGTNVVIDGAMTRRVHF